MRYGHMKEAIPRSAKQIAFNVLTLELLQHKYRYYLQSAPIVSDTEYDRLEKEWTVLGTALGYEMDYYEPWVDFPTEHIYAKLFPGRFILTVGGEKK